MSNFSYVNIRGLKPKTVASKVPLISDLLIQKNQLFFALTETWLKDEKDAEISIKGYQVFRADKQATKKKFGRFSGGVAIYIRNDAASTFETVFQFTKGGCEMIIVKSHILKMIICCLYRQPDESSTNAAKESLNKLSKVLEDLPHYNSIICGDFNLPHVIWNSNPEPGAKCTKGEKEVLDYIVTLMNTHFLTQIVTKPTHVHGNLLDLIFTNNENMLHEVQVIKPYLRSYTDHYFIEISTNLQSSTPTITKNTDQRPFHNLNFHSEGIDWQAIKQELSKVNWEHELEHLDPDNIVDAILKISLEVSQKFVPERKSRIVKHKIPRDRRLLMKRRGKINKRLLSMKSDKCKLKLENELIEIEKNSKNPDKIIRYLKNLKQ